MVAKNILLKLISLCFVFSSYSCGQTGDLYLPEEKGEIKKEEIKKKGTDTNAPS